MDFLDVIHKESNLISLELEGDLAPLISNIKDRKLVCLGDASHGTHEFYDWRMKITLELIKNHGFKFVGFEGDWPDFELINKFLQDPSEESKKKSIDELLVESFKRWPSWMWANFEMKEFIQNICEFNMSVPPDQRVRFHGLDLYSIEESKQRVREIQDELDRVEDMDAKKREWLLFDSGQNKKVMHNGKRYKHASGIGDDRSWKIRDQHMMDTLNSLFDYYGPESKGIVWAHINHVSDFRKTEPTSVSLGGLAREALGKEAVALIAFITYSGAVIASPHWDGPVKEMVVPPAKVESIESALHTISEERYCENLLLLFDKKSAQFPGPVPYRFIAVVYDPETERYENYVVGKLQERFDAVFFIDKTEALKPIWPSLYLESGVEENQFL